MTGRPTARRLATQAARPVALAAALLLGGPLAAAPKLPADAQAFVARRADCAHWVGEDAYDAGRGRQIAAAVKRLRCDAVEADEARLRRRYRDDPAILKALDPAGDAAD